ncbi:MAG: isoprenylcysteine carboxylmethyltransferase family protein [Candidatus Saccharimonadales bacterium]
MKDKLINALPDLTLLSTIMGALLLGKLIPGPQVFPAAVNSILGAMLIIGGIGCSVAILVFMIRRGGSTDVVKTSEQLITSKFFSVSRNPLYLAELTLIVGVATLVGSLAAFIGPVVYFLVLNFIVIPYEEKKLEVAFGKSYTQYRQSIRRWV